MGNRNFLKETATIENGDGESLEVELSELMKVMLETLSDHEKRLEKLEQEREK